jgi:hypothetical protein
MRRVTEGLGVGGNTNPSGIEPGKREAEGPALVSNTDRSGAALEADEWRLGDAAKKGAAK